jgi:hypothetical protein
MVAAFSWFWDTPSWNWSYCWAAAFLLAPFALGYIARLATNRKPRLFIDLVNGKDGHWSTSKTAFGLWTLAIWFAFLAILFHTQGAGLVDVMLNGEYFVVLGIPAVAAVAAKGIVVSKIASGDLTRPTGDPQPNVVQGVGELVSDDEGRADLLDFQYFGFSLILLGFFLLQFFGHPGSVLPDLPDSLLALTGVSAFAYVGKKGLEKDTGPTIRSVVPPAGPAGTSVTIRGVNLATKLRPQADVLFGSLQATNPTVDTFDDVAVLTTSVPSGAAAGQYDLVVVAFDGRSSNGIPFTVT